ncbi:MAG: fimbrillin family protein, partial [Prevotella sp.]
CIYPSTVDLNSGLFTVQLSQGPDEDYRKSDLMYVVTSRMSHDQVDLQFKHLLSKITIKVDPNGLMTQQELIGSLYGVELLNVYKQVSIASDFSVTASGEKTQWIDALWDNGVYNPSNGVSCIIPPQTVEAGAQFIAVNINDENVFRYTVPSGGHAFKGGKEYVFNIKLVQSGIELANMTVKNWDTETFNVDAK